jgi:alpha-mannosidase
VPLAEAADRTFAEGQFAVVERPRLQEAGFGEDGLGAYPASAFVAAGGVALLFEHVAEYELAGANELAVTILRSVGLISRAANPFRRVNAGPEHPIPAAQMHGAHAFSFAWCGDPHQALDCAERYRHPMLTAPGGTGEKSAHSGPELRGALLSSLRRRSGALDARVVNETSAPATVEFGTAKAELRAWEIRTLRLDS